MHKFFCLFIAVFLLEQVKASPKDSTIYYNLPDSVKAVQFMAEFTIKGTDKKARRGVGIKTNAVSLIMQKFPFGSGGRISFSCPSYSNVIATGVNAKYDRKFQDIGWSYDWKLNETYRLLIAQATDSAGNFSLYSGYVFLPNERKWKFIGTCKIDNQWSSIKQPSAYYYARKNSLAVHYNQVWIQRQSGSWKNLQDETLPPPVINLSGHVDSAQQRQKEIKQIEDSIAAGKINAKQNEQGVYYEILNQGNGRQVTVDDTVTVHYKGSLFSDGTVFDQTKDKPANFPLKRLIRGWQVGVPLLKVGGKIKLIIPSDMAYSIRTRAAKIPPNSILVFEVEVLEAKAP